MVIMIYVLHCLEKPLEFMENIRKYLKPDAPIVIIERDTQRERAHPPSFMTNREILETIGDTAPWHELRQYLESAYDFVPELLNYGKQDES